MTAEALRLIVSYDPSTGQFSRRRDGRPIGFLVASKGNACLHVLGKKYNAHRVAWLYMTGAWPLNEIDHINGVKTDNRWSNLRDVTRAVNSQNQRRAHKRNRTGLLGVTEDVARGKFRAAIFVDGRKRLLGRFATAEAAHAKYLEAKRRLHPGCTI